MENNESTLKIAEALTPIMAYLAERGIIGVGGRSGHIQLTTRKFREIWPDVTPDSRNILTAAHDGFVYTAWGVEGGGDV